MSRLIVCLCSIVLTTVCVAQSPTVNFEQSFRAASSREEKARIASQLVRMGSRDPRYWKFLAGEAEQGLKGEAAAAAEWRRKHTTVDESRMASSDRPSSGDGSRTIDATTTHLGLGENTANAPATSSRHASPTHSVTTSYSVTPRPADATHLLPFIYLSMTGKPESRQYLVRALSTDNALLAAQGAMGLAKLGATDMIATIAAAAIRFPQERLLFAQALAYFNDAEADRQAVDLIPDVQLYAQLQEVARASNYDPYPVLAR
jgi:hypothetical protein